jgi:hypothetical protein
MLGLVTPHDHGEERQLLLPPTRDGRSVARDGRSVAEELGAYLAGRPHDPADLVFTAPRGGPVRSSKLVPVRTEARVHAVLADRGVGVQEPLSGPAGRVLLAELALPVVQRAIVTDCLA